MSESIRSGDVPARRKRDTSAGVSVDERLLEILCRHLSAVNARAVLRRSAREVGLRGRPSTTKELPDLIARVERATAVFLRPKAHAELRQQLSALCDEQDLAAETIAIEHEQDIVVARTRARAICAALGGRAVFSQKAATVVSELARNIALYTPGGTIELVPTRAPRQLLVRATDRGAGIPNLDEIMSGGYRSKTGLGRGLLGTKQVVDQFTIETGAGGTRIEVSLRA